MALTYSIDEDIVRFPAKHPSGVRDYTVDMATFLGVRTISSIAVSAVDPTGELAIDSSSNTTTAFTVTVSAGTHDTDYEFTVTATLSTGEVEPVVIVVPVHNVGA